ncbi:class I SAM-dependent methyltransferase [Azospirillum halopraeferens]|uniref:class I SAM-dependent methyltransferase n=1 Tax=Azospirillum halopraeferens TaxID=34010 RepID=UPI0004071EFB|nr:class I SAM-dependent methyltransferase [Azospirillum halopraeferens]
MISNASPPPACRACGAPLTRSFADLGSTPVSNAFRRAGELTEPEPFFPLHAYVCDSCHLVQLRDFRAPEHLFTDDYAYFSSYSTSWLRHAEAYTQAMVERFGIGSENLVVEVASNDGYLLRYFKARGVPVFGVEPCANVAAAAERNHGIRSVVRFFGAETARDMVADGLAADLMAANNVLAHVPDPNDFLAGFAILLKPSGVVTFEFPHLLRLIAGRQFDTIYHEHYSYLSLLAVENLLARHGLAAFDVEELATHGGSLRLFAGHAGAVPEASASLRAVRVQERSAGLDTSAPYDGFAEEVRRTKRRLLSELIALKDAGARIAGYGAPAKGNTLLNYCGIGRDFIDFTVDRSPQKQGLYLPGTAIPILAPEAIAEARPDYVLILPWNLKDEIVAQMAGIAQWGGRFIVPIPDVAVIDPADQ